MGAYGVVHNIYFLGGAASVWKNMNYHKKCLKVVSGRIVNGFSKKDMVLHTYRITTFLYPIGHGEILTDSAKLKKKKIEMEKAHEEGIKLEEDEKDEIDNVKLRVENYDLTNVAGMHTQYRKNLPNVLKFIKFSG